MLKTGVRLERLGAARRRRLVSQHRQLDLFPTASEIPYPVSGGRIQRRVWGNRYTCQVDSPRLRAASH